MLAMRRVAEAEEEEAAAQADAAHAWLEVEKAQAEAVAARRLANAARVRRAPSTHSRALAKLGARVKISRRSPR